MKTSDLPSLIPLSSSLTFYLYACLQSSLYRECRTKSMIRLFLCQYLCSLFAVDGTISRSSLRWTIHLSFARSCSELVSRCQTFWRRLWFGSYSAHSYQATLWSNTLPASHLKMQNWDLHTSACKCKLTEARSVQSEWIKDWRDQLCPSLEVIFLQ